MIPKKIHYCWFGGNPKPQLVLDCMESWKKFCPDYEIIEWNESNYDVNFCENSRYAYEAKKWAFVSDIARIKIIYEQGGIYLDTDVLLKNSLDDLLCYDAWFATEDIRWINTGAGFGAIKGHELLLMMLDKHTNCDFDMSICTGIDTPVIRNYLKLPQSRNSQCINNIFVIGMYDYAKYGKHLYSGSWVENKKSKPKSKRFWKFKYKLRSPRVINYLERNGETKLSKLYVFCVYDLLDCGPLYYLKRLFNKMKSK